MPPSQKGTGKKGGRDVRQSRSRNTTPSSVPPSDAVETGYLELPVKDFRTWTYDELVGPLTAAAIPDFKSLKNLQDRLDQFLKAIDERGDVCNRGMRLISKMRKDRPGDDDLTKDDERRARRDDDDEKLRLASKHKRKKDAKPDGMLLDSSPSTPLAKKAGRRQSRDSVSSSLTPVEGQSPSAAAAAAAAAAKEKKHNHDMDVDDDESSSDEAPTPAPAVPLQTFGDDPSTFPDPTVYEIREVKPGMTEDEIKEIYSVAQYPHTDLADLVPGVPPDKDFSNAKPTNQVQANTFETYLQPFFRPFNDEDLAFLRERGDRVRPFVMPRRGKKHYTEVWAEEDGTMAIDMPAQGRDKLPTNQGRGSIEAMDDSVAETEQLSTGPILSRLLSTLRPEHRAATGDERTNGVNGDAVNGDAHGDDGPSDESRALAVATHMADSSTEAWKKAIHPKLDHAQVDERVKQEFRYLGFLLPETEPDFDAHYDDDVAARARYLQSKLKEVSIRNAARKARIMDLVRERMAHQEYTTILEDLDSQVQAAYLKRTRTLGKSKKTKRPGGAGGGSHFVSNGGGASGMARPAIGDNTKLIMSRRRDWMDTISPIFDNERVLGRVPRAADPGSSIFKDDDMRDFLRREAESWDDGEGDEED